VGRTSVDDLPAEHAGLLEVGEPLGEGRRRDAAERLEELVEADGALVVDLQDLDRQTSFEEVRGAAHLLWER
jgi:hypothetical protein